MKFKKINEEFANLLEGIETELATTRTSKALVESETRASSGKVGSAEKECPKPPTPPIYLPRWPALSLNAWPSRFDENQLKPMQKTERGEISIW